MESQAEDLVDLGVREDIQVPGGFLAPTYPADLIPCHPDPSWLRTSTPQSSFCPSGLPFRTFSAPPSGPHRSLGGLWVPRFQVPGFRRLRKEAVPTLCSPKRPELPRGQQGTCLRRTLLLSLEISGAPLAPPFARAS